ncbi:uncharacterized protein LOC130169565 [Seriola aureovittata]|uniref:uncharacterized protein LOC130169565 n=1 Tax=Seriola aureovittata TaxID=2871759 RepID=UPI0024BEAAC0|nr:uncharacterized protein LOC130169565 [Seriola aureovittata]
MENPTFRRCPNGTLLMGASSEAQALGRRPVATVKAKKPEEVDAEAWAHVASEGGDTGNATLILSRWKVQFGSYQGKTFHWLLENDVGYAVNLVASHQKERESTGSESPLMANKDALTRYSSAYPDFVEAVRFHSAFEEARVKSLQPGQEGQALVGFGDFKFETLQSLYESEDPIKIRFVNYLRRKAPAPGTQMENVVRYVKKRDRQRASAATASTAMATTATATTATATAITATASSSSASVLAVSQGARSASKPLGSALTAFVCGRRSLSAVEMQAKIKKLVATQPAFPASSRPALPSVSSEEISDQELVRAVVDIEESSEVQAPLSLSPPHRSPPPPPLPVPATAARPLPPPAPAAQTAPAPAARTAAATAATLQAPVEHSMEELPAPAVLPPPQPAGCAELLPVSWRAALTVEQQQWIGQVLFTRDSSGRPRLTGELSLWWHPPQARPIYNQPPASPNPFFACRLFLWMPHRMWCLQLTCPQPSCTGSMTKAGLYRTIRRVLDIDGWYLMATEYLECCRCKKKVGGWSQGIIRQLSPTYSCQFPAILTYKLSCDLRVVQQLRSRTLGNSATRLYNTLREAHSDSWMRKAIEYLGVCEQFLALRGHVTPPPQMPPVPSPVWLLTVYGYDVLTRLEEYKARITSTFGSILKMDSTKKVTKKLAGAASDTAACVTNVGNEYGQVLMSVLTCSEGTEGLSRMAAGLMRRYRLAGVPPPQLMYVNHDCCRRDGPSKTAALFHEWGQLVVRLDIWHLMWRFASGVTTESHELYPTFMRQLSDCIFEVDPGDAGRLMEAKRSQLEGRHGTVALTDAEVIRRISREEWRLHCRRRTRGAEETTLLIQELLNTFGGPAGRDTLGVPLLDAFRIQDIWSTQRRHISCIQDPAGVQLYTQTGRLTKGGFILPVYRCARGSTSLGSFHLHLNRFIPGKRASAKYFQAFLVDGLVRWNEDRAAAAAPPSAAEGQVASLHSYSGHLKHVLNLKSQRVLGLQMVKDFTKPAEYTGELIGVEFLFAQTGRVLEDVSVDPDVPDEAAAVELLEEVDEGMEEDVEDPTVFGPDTPSTSAAARSGDPADAPRSEPAASHQDAPPEAPEVQAPALQPPSSDSDGSGMVPAPASAHGTAPPATGLSLVQVGQGQPLTCHIPEDQPGPPGRGLPPPPPPPPPVDEEQPRPSSAAGAPPLAPLQSSAPQPPPLPGRVPRTTAYRKRKAAEASATGPEPLPGAKAPRRQPTSYTCSKCGQPKRIDTGHTRIAGVSYCAAVGGKTVEEWREEMKKKQRRT